MRVATIVAGAAAGALAGAVGTAAMDVLWFSRYRRGGGDASFPAWETAQGVTSYDAAPAPAKVAHRVAGALGRDLDPGTARLATNLVHWGTGLGWGAAYGKVRALTGVQPHPLVGGVLLGATAWATTYVVLPPLGAYEPITHYDAATLAQDASAHLLFGVTTAAALAVLLRR